MSETLEVLHCDNHVLVVVKPACVPIVPDESGDRSLLEIAKSWVKREYEKPGAVFLGVVHRLDRPVSGVVVFGRTSKGAARLSAQFRDREVEKIYHGVVPGVPPQPEGEIEQFLRKDERRNRVIVEIGERGGAKLARTSYRVLRRVGENAILELRPHTGRPHQLRVACASLGLPLLGDLKYGAPEPLPDRSIALHAFSLRFQHPTRAETLHFQRHFGRTVPGTK
jgi:23S rRNA pseudouridine1911/1915/1917 synthase